MPLGSLITQFRNLNTLESKTHNFIKPLLSTSETYNHWIWKKEETINDVSIRNIKPIQLPNNLFWIPPCDNDYTKANINEISEPDRNNHNIEAARLIVIRRKKMKKHKLKKLRKKMKYEWAKVGCNK